MQNGDIYIGVFTNGFINGNGIYINKNGEKYVGNFEGGKKMEKENYLIKKEI